MKNNKEVIEMEIQKLLEILIKGGFDEADIENEEIEDLIDENIDNILSKRLKTTITIKELGCTILGSFENENGESYLLYKFPKQKIIFITGDELDWELGWECNKEGNVYKEVDVTEEEKENIKKFFK